MFLLFPFTKIITITSTPAGGFPVCLVTVEEVDVVMVREVDVVVMVEEVLVVRVTSSWGSTKAKKAMNDNPVI